MLLIESSKAVLTALALDVGQLLERSELRVGNGEQVSTFALLAVLNLVGVTYMVSLLDKCCAMQQMAFYLLVTEVKIFCA